MGPFLVDGLGERRIGELSGVDMDELHEFLSFGVYLSVQAAMGGIDDLEAFKAQRQAALERRQPDGA